MTDPDCLIFQYNKAVRDLYLEKWASAVTLNDNIRTQNTNDSDKLVVANEHESAVEKM